MHANTKVWVPCSLTREGIFLLKQSWALRVTPTGTRPCGTSNLDVNLDISKGGKFNLGSHNWDLIFFSLVLFFSPLCPQELILC